MNSINPTNPTNPEIKILSKLLTPVFRKNGVEKALLFGAMARGTATRHSDIDLMIVMPTQKRFFDRYDLFNEIHDLIKRKSIDLLIYSPEELKAISHRSFIKKILDEGVTVYELGKKPA